MQKKIFYSLFAMLVFVSLGAGCCGPNWQHSACDFTCPSHDGSLVSDTAANTEKGYFFEGDREFEGDRDRGSTVGLAEYKETAGDPVSSECHACSRHSEKRGLFELFHKHWANFDSNRWQGSGGGDVYISSWKSDPPDYSDPCDRCGHWTGAVACKTNCWKDLFYRPLSRLTCKAYGLQGESSCSMAVACACGTACGVKDSDCTSGYCGSVMERAVSRLSTQEAFDASPDQVYQQTDQRIMLPVSPSPAGTKNVAVAHAETSLTTDPVPSAR